MNEQGSLTRASRVKREIASSGAANGNAAGGAGERYAAAAASALAKGEKRYVRGMGLPLAGRIRSRQNAERSLFSFFPFQILEAALLLSRGCCAG